MRRELWVTSTAILTLLLLTSSVKLTVCYSVDQESNTGNSFQAWTSTQWPQTSYSDFELGNLTDVDILSSAGDVKLTYSEGEYVSSGTIASQVLDTGIAGATWDELLWDETLPAGTDITLEVRASDTQFLKDDATPSWTSVGGSSPVTAGLPSGQYMQWRASLTTSDTSETPVMHEVIVDYY